MRGLLAIVALCRPEQRRPFRLSCLNMEHVQSFEKPLIFDGLIAASVRAELAKSLVSRNGQNYSFPSLGIDDLLLAEPEHVDGVLYRVPRITRGYASFSRPAYSGQGQALIYAEYFCGALCAYGWFFLLENSSNAWRVQSVQLMWIS